MLEPSRRGCLQQPSGYFHGISLNITGAELHDAPGGLVMVRLSALLAAFTLITDTVVDTTESAFVVTLLGFAWHAGVQVTWGGSK
ncbi:hypothetical protein ACIBCP_16305 [Streptomyces sp. NPDC051287]|uniref:hypothetical protein n=1 Tax=Streptomyces sp. NPDC051287 TaxID=3365648 RepID=UPI0037ACDA37